jgi:hypothetical protein
VIPINNRALGGRKSARPTAIGSGRKLEKLNMNYVPFIFLSVNGEPSISGLSRYELALAGSSLCHTSATALGVLSEWVLS